MTHAATTDAPSPSPAVSVPESGRVQLALNVDDLEQSIGFYSQLFNTAPAKVKDGYANFAIDSPPLKLVLLQNAGAGGTLNHLGVEVSTSDEVRAEIARLSDEGLVAAEEMGGTCCYATQDKVWAQAPDGERWEVYTVVADSDTFGLSPKSGLAEAEGGVDICCGTSESSSSAANEAACC